MRQNRLTAKPPGIHLAAKRLPKILGFAAFQQGVMSMLRIDDLNLPEPLSHTEDVRIWYGWRRERFSSKFFQI